MPSATSGTTRTCPGTSAATTRRCATSRAWGGRSCATRTPASTCGSTGAATSTPRATTSTRRSTTCSRAGGAASRPSRRSPRGRSPMRSRPAAARAACACSPATTSTVIVDDTVVAYLRDLSRFADIYYLADCPLEPGELDKLAPYTKGRWAIRHGRYDFGSYSMLAKELVGWDVIEPYDELVLANDSCYLVQPFDRVFARMDAETADWWGLQATYEKFNRPRVRARRRAAPARPHRAPDAPARPVAILRLRPRRVVLPGLPLPRDRRTRSSAGASTWSPSSPTRRRSSSSTRSASRATSSSAATTWPPSSTGSSPTTRSTATRPSR